MIKKIKVSLNGFNGKNVLVHSDVFHGFKSTNSKSRKELLKEQIKSVCRKNLDKYKVPVKLFFEKLEITKRGKKM